MRNDKDMGWLVAYGLAAALLIITILNSELVEAAACAADDKHCLRDWVAALSGWAAVIAAVPTVVFLSRQVAIAQRQAQDTFKVDLRRSLALAESTHRAARELITWSTLFVNTPGFYKDEEAWELFQGTVADVREILQLEVFERFEAEIAFPKKFHLAFLKRRSSEFEQEYGRYVQATVIYDDDTLTRTVDRWNGILEQTRSYGEDCLRLSNEFIEDCRDMINSYR